MDLVVMVDGYEGERGTVVAGGRGYFLKVTSFILSFFISIDEISNSRERWCSWSKR